MKNLNFKDLMGKWKALPAKTKNLVMVMLGIAIFLAAYLLGFQKLSDATTEVQGQVDQMTARVAELKEYYDNLEVYNAGIKDAKASINENLSHLPIGIQTEDSLEYIKNMNDKIGSNLSSVAFDADSFIGEFGCQINDQNVTASAMCASVSYNATMSYTQFKNTLKYIYEQTDNIVFVDNVSLTYDEAESRLSASFALNEYYITYEGGEYTGTTMPNVSTGVSDPFGTK